MNRTFRTQARHGYSVKFSPYFPQRLACSTSQYYGIAGTGTLFVLDVLHTDVVVVRQFEWNDGLFDVTWAENNENILLAAGGDGSLQVWDVAQPQGPLKVFKEHTKEVNSVDWSQTRNEHLVLSASWDQYIKLWDISQTKSLETFGGHQHIVYQAKWSPQILSCFASASGDHTVQLWDGRKSNQAMLVLPAHEGEVLTCDWSKYQQHTLFSSGVDGLIKGWDIRKPDRPQCIMRGHRYAVKKIQTSPFNGSILASASYDFSVKIWDIERELCLDTIEHHTEFVYGLDFNLHIPGQMADCAWDELVHIYQPSSPG